MRDRLNEGALALLIAIAVAAALGACESSPSPVFADEGFGSCDRPAEGCPCEAGRVAACYPDQPFVDEEGAPYCVEGLMECGPDGRWGACVFPDGAGRYAIVGDPELCGGCDPACRQVHDCPTERDLDATNSNNVRYDLDAEGLVLGGQLFNARYAYIANAPDSTVSKLDLSTGVEVARYLVGRPGFRCSAWAGGCNQPSRTAIDSRGDAYVANRGFGGMGTVTKMAGDEANCYDRNRNGVIDTSSGPADVRAWGDDECVLWTVDIGDGCLPRAVAVDAEDRVWVGCYNWRRFYVLDPSDGSVLRFVDVSLYPYGAAIAGDGRLWFPNGCCGRSYVQSIDTTTFALEPYHYNDGGCAGSYGIAVDTSGRVLVGGYGVGVYAGTGTTGCISRFDPAADTWEAFWTQDSRGATRGVTVDADGHIWAASHYGGDGPHWLTRWNEDGSGRITYTLRDTASGETCGVPIGVGADFEGRIWTPCQNTSNAARVDPDTGAVQMLSTGPNPYTYSDFTGFLRATITSPEGSYTRRHDARFACAADQDTNWSQLYYDVSTPAGSEINFWGRTADAVTDLGMAAEVLLASVPGDASPSRVAALLDSAGVPNGMRYFEVRVELRSLDGTTSPIFRSMDMVYYCVCSCNASSACDPGCTCDEDC